MQAEREFSRTLASGEKKKTRKTKMGRCLLRMHNRTTESKENGSVVQVRLGFEFLSRASSALLSRVQIKNAAEPLPTS